MPITQNLIPIQERVSQIELVYKEIEEYLKNKLFSIGVLNYSDERALRIKRDVKKKVKVLDLRVIRWSNVAIPESYDQSKGIGGSRLKRFGMRKDSRFDESRHTRTIDKGIDLTENVFLKANRSINSQVAIYLNLLKKASNSFKNVKIQELSTMDRAVVDDIIEAGLGAEKTLTQISRDVFTYFQDQFGEGAFIKIKGKNYVMSKYSRMVARTQMRIIQTQATKNVSKQYDNDLVRWSEHFNPCPRCEPFEGMIYSLSGTSEIYDILDDEPPLHPNCEHFLDPYPEVLALAG